MSYESEVFHSGWGTRLFLFLHALSNISLILVGSSFLDLGHFLIHTWLSTFLNSPMELLQPTGFPILCSSLPVSTLACGFSPLVFSALSSISSVQENCWAPGGVYVFASPHDSQHVQIQACTNDFLLWKITALCCFLPMSLQLWCPLFCWNFVWS